MPFCPECKYEYRSDISKCPDCNIGLVASLDNNINHNSKDSTSVPEYSEELKKIMKSLPSAPGALTGLRGQSSCQSKKCQTDNYSIDPDSEFAKKLDKFETWIEIAHFPNESTSQMVTGGLESIEIPFVLIPGSRISWAGDGIASTTPDILLVPEEYVERADTEAENIIGDNYQHFRTQKS